MVFLEFLFFTCFLSLRVQRERECDRFLKPLDPQLERERGKEREGEKERLFFGPLFFFARHSFRLHCFFLFSSFLFGRLARRRLFSPPSTSVSR